MYDSTNDTLLHIQKVRNNIRQCIGQLYLRIEQHDKSKLESPEKEIFDEYTPKLRDTAYDKEDRQKAYDKIERIKRIIGHYFIEHELREESLAPENYR